MVDQVRIFQGQQTGHQAIDEGKQPVQAKWNGLSVILRQERDVDSEIRRTQYRQNNGLDSPADRKTLQERAVNLDMRSLNVSADVLGKLSKVFGGDASTTKLAQKYLNYFRGEQERPKQDGSMNNMLQHYVALHKLSAALQKNDADFVARMTPQSDGNFGLDELAKKLVDAGDDPARMQQALSDVDGLPEDSDELHGLMKTLRFKPDDLKRKLRDAQNLPELSTDEKKALQELVEDVLLQLEIDEGSRIKAARNGIEKGFESGDPESFIESYTNALEHTGSFLQTLTTLAKRHKPDELRHVIPLMKQTLADELQLGQDERTTDKIKLECLLSELSYMHISTTLIEKINRLVKGMQRIYGQPATA